MPRAPRKPHATALAFDAITVEGALIAPAMLTRIAEQKASWQAEADYNVPKGLTLRDEISRYFRIGQALFKELFVSATPSMAATTRAVEALLRDVFGFADVGRAGLRTLGEHAYPVTLEASGGHVPIVIVPPGDAVDQPSPHLPSEGRQRSAASALQDWLNANDAALWGLCSNGENLRVLRDNSSLTRPAFIEADLPRIFEGEAFADFAALWLLLHASRFGTPGALPADCPLEHWREAGGKEGVAARERLRDGVEAALLSLGGGFLGHPDNAALRERLASGALPQAEYFGQLLRLVYRLIFLLAAEDRNLLHPPSASAAARRLYAEGYSLAALRDRAIRRTAWDRHHDRWEGLQIVFAALARGERRLGLPALGGLFEPGTIPDLETARLANHQLMEAIYRLAWLREESGIVLVNWRDMETEELGSVYESLLELTPRLTADGRGFAFAEAGEAKGSARKTSGSYYTPDSLVQALLDSALDPVLDRIEAEADDPVKALLSVTVIDPACGSGHFLLAAARRIATRTARHRTGGVASAEDYRHALREVARASIHGVDRNPLAVELTKVALWIETVEPGKPLGFLDANIRCGDSLVGVFDLDALRHGIPDAAYKPLSGDDKETARYFAKRNKAEREGQGHLDFAGGRGHLSAAAPLVDEARALRAMAEDSSEEIAAKRRRFEAGRADPKLWAIQIAADIYTAAFLIPKTGGVPANRDTVTIPTTAHVWDALAGRTIYGPLVGRSQDLAGAVQAFHWPLEFPDVMAAGGFDAVLGNPPWERIKLQEQEFFAARDPEIATAANKSTRERLIKTLRDAEPGTHKRALLEEFETEKRLSEATSAFVRVDGVEGGRFPFTGTGDVNTYALFAELFSRLAGEKGRAGVIVPTGVATDATTAPFFAHLVAERRLANIFDFENRAGLFPAVDSRLKFCLLTLGRDESEARFAFFLTDPSQLAEPERNFTLSPEQIAAINPNTHNAPGFRTVADAELSAKVYVSNPCFGLPKKLGGWGPRFLKKMFDFGIHQDLLDFSMTRPSQDHLPIYEAKMITHFNYRFATYEGVDEEVAEKGSARGCSTEELRDPFFEIAPRCWTLRDNFEKRIANRDWNFHWFLSMRDKARATDERTAIFSVRPYLPSNDTLPTVFIDAEPTVIAALAGNLSSLALDYFARQKVSGINFAAFIVEQLPVLPPNFYTLERLAFTARRVLELTYTSYSLASFARDLGYDGPPFPWDEARRAYLRAELDAFYARAYGLSRDELRYILDPEDAMGAGYPSDTFRVLKKNEIARYGEYRTARLVLAAWDAQEVRPAAA
jgi:hypothetical protein